MNDLDFGGNLRLALQRDADLVGEPSPNLLEQLAQRRTHQRRRRFGIVAGIAAVVVVAAGIPIGTAVLARSDGAPATQSTTPSIAPTPSSAPGDGTATGVITLAKVDGWRQTPSADESPSRYFSVAEIAYDEATARQAWRESVPDGLPERTGEPREPGLYGSLDDVDFTRQVLVVYSSGQSGSCPGWLADIAVVGSTVEFTHDAYVPGDACTDDYRGYHVVLAVDRDKVPPADELPTEHVRIDGSTDLPGLVRAYPVASSGTGAEAGATSPTPVGGGRGSHPEGWPPAAAATHGGGYWAV